MCRLRDGVLTFGIEPKKGRDKVCQKDQNLRADAAGVMKRVPLQRDLREEPSLDNFFDVIGFERLSPKGKRKRVSEVGTHEQKGSRKKQISLSWFRFTIYYDSLSKKAQLMGTMN